MSPFQSYRSLLTVAPLGVVLLGSLAHASDGLIEINQIQTLAGGVTPGDTPGFPLTISAPGSYVLTGNLTVGDLNTTAIQVSAASGVTIDLNGFTIKGACPVPAGCSAGAGTSIGIDAVNASGTVLRDGRVRGFGSDGVDPGSNARVSGLFVEGNGGAGIAAGSGSEISDSRTFDNAGAGIIATASSVRSCSAEENLDGMVLGQLSLAIGNTVIGNGRIGILVNGVGTTVRQNIVSLNAADGIAVVASGSLVIDNVAYGNASGGIAVLTGGSVQRNASFNNAIGIYLYPEAGGNPAAYRGNVVNRNTVATVTDGINVGENSCNGNATCP